MPEELKSSYSKNIYDGVTVIELLEGYSIYKQLLDANLLKMDKETRTIMLDGDESIKFLENQNLDLKRKSDLLLLKLMFATSPTDHLLDDAYKEKFKQAILNNLDKTTTEIKKILKDIWED